MAFVFVVQLVNIVFILNKVARLVQSELQEGLTLLLAERDALCRQQVLDDFLLDAACAERVQGAESSE